MLSKPILAGDHQALGIKQTAEIEIKESTPSANTSLVDVDTSTLLELEVER